MRVALTGASGLVGSRITELLSDTIDFVDVPQEEVDITDKKSINDKISSIDFDVFLHLAAYTNVEGAENNKDLCFQINVEGTRNIFEAIQNKSKKFIYISTGMVFDGTNPPYDEDSTPNARGVYAESKLEGEKVINGEAMIVRIEYPYRAKYDLKKDFVKGIRDRLENGQELAGVTDSIFTPTFIDDIAYGLKHLIENFSPEVYHLVGTKSLSPYEAFIAIARNWSLDESLIKKTTYQEYFAGKAFHPQYAEIKSKKNNFHQMKSFEEGLKTIK